MKPTEKSIEGVISTIADFLNGTGGPYDWDDFLTFSIRDQRLDAVRMECAELPDRYPREKCRQYCSDAGLERLGEILASLKAN